MEVIRKEIKDFMRTAEILLSESLRHDLSREERDIIYIYLEKLREAYDEHIP
jgi:hypothetical protein